jgi:hypothetical protein
VTEREPVPERGVTRLLLAGGVMGPPLFVIAFLIEGATRPDYDVGRHVVSLLSLGDQGWQQMANFIVTGLLVVGFGLGLGRVLHSGPGSRWGPILVAVGATRITPAACSLIRKESTPG